MKPRLWMVLILGLLLTASSAAQDKDKDKTEDAKEKAVKEEMKKFDGTWDVIFLERAGQKLPMEKWKALNIQVIFADKKMTWKMGGGSSEATYQIDPAKNPKEIDILGEKNTKPEKGIYKLEGDTLTLCASESGGDRPTEFVSRSGTSSMILVLKKAK